MISQSTSLEGRGTGFLLGQGNGLAGGVAKGNAPCLGSPSWEVRTQTGMFVLMTQTRMSLSKHLGPEPGLPQMLLLPNCFIDCPVVQETKVTH